MATPPFTLEARYGKQSVPVFKLRRQGEKHEIIDMMVKVMLEGAVQASWLTGDNHQILPTETQKNTCYAIALKASFSCLEEYGLALATDLLQRHRHLTSVSLDMVERVWEPVVIGGKAHNHVFSSAADPVKRTCALVMRRGLEAAPCVRSGVRDIKLMKTTQSGFAGFIVDEYTNLQPVGAGTSTPDRIMCTLLEATWEHARAPPGGYGPANAAILATLIGVFAGPVDGGVYSSSVQQTAYKMCTEVLRRYDYVSRVYLATPNIHHYRYALEAFGLANDTVFQSTDCASTASGRIETTLSRPKPSL